MRRARIAANCSCCGIWEVNWAWRICFSFGRELVILAKAPRAAGEDRDVGEWAASAWPDVHLW